jgi:hypothetical protein
MMAYKPCKYLDAKPGERIMKDSFFRCLCPIPVMPVFPVSITKAYGFRFLIDKDKCLVRKEDCAACPLYEGRKG